MRGRIRPKVSVILPVYNEEKYIKKCLESIVNQTLKPDEIFVIDDGSTDASVSIISNLQSPISNLKILKQKHKGPAIARNLGARKAHGDILVFLDADMAYGKGFLKEIIKPITEGKEIATFTKKEYVANLDNPWARFWDDVTFSNSGKRVPETLGERGTTFRAIKDSVFWKVGGYDSYGSSDDRSVLAKLGKTSKNVPFAICYHYNPSSLSEVFYSARWMGRDRYSRGRFLQFLIFSPLWSLLKAVVGSVSRKNVNFIPFRLVFDFGYLIGLASVHLKGVHYK